MPLTTTEVPTFFGPSDSPLFGVVHLPVDNQTVPSGLPVGTAWTSLSALDVADGPTPPPVAGPISRKRRDQPAKE